MARSWGGTLARKITEQSNIAAELRPQTGGGTLGLVDAGIVHVTGVTFTSDSHVSVSMLLAGGTLGVGYVITPVSDTAFDITSVDTAGATEAADTSRLSWAIIS